MKIRTRLTLQFILTMAGIVGIFAVTILWFTNFTPGSRRPPGGFLIAAVIVIVLGGLLVWLLVRRAMRPLEQLAATTSEIAEASDHALRLQPEGPPDEINRPRSDFLRLFHSSTITKSPNVSQIPTSCATRLKKGARGREMRLMKGKGKEASTFRRGSK